MEGFYGAGHARYFIFEGNVIAMMFVRPLQAVVTITTVPGSSSRSA